MPTLIIRNIPPETAEALKRLADSQDRSRESYIRRLLAEHVKERTRKMYRYTVTVKPNTDPMSPGAFVGVGRVDPDAVMEYEDTDADGNEIHTITTEHDINRLLDLEPAVLSYEVCDIDSPQYAAYYQKPDDGGD